MKYNVPKRPPNVSTAAYLKLIARPTPIPTLSDLLNDYGKSKIIGKYLNFQISYIF